MSTRPLKIHYRVGFNGNDRPYCVCQTGGREPRCFSALLEDVTCRACLVITKRNIDKQLAAIPKARNNRTGRYENGCKVSPYTQIVCGCGCTRKRK